MVQHRVVEGGHNQDATRSNAGRRRLTVPDAAEALGISIEAVRGRIKRGTIPHEREGDRVYVLVDADQPRPGRDQDDARSDDQGALVESLQDQVADLRSRLDREQEANRENRRIIAALTSRIPAIEAPAEQPPAEASPEAPES